MESEKIKSQTDSKSNGLGKSNEKNEKKRLNVLKTYKLYIDGKFPRTESGRYYLLNDARGNQLANMCLSSRKDFRDSVVAARKAQPAWASRTAYNKGQILYRIAEVLEGRRSQFEQELQLMGVAKAEEEVSASIDRLIYYAGWSDKYVQVFSSVNPVESSHFNFSIPEPMGVVAVIAPESTGLIGLVSMIAPAIVGGNTCIVLASESLPLCAVTFAEVLHSSDVPAGVVNLLTGKSGELMGHFSTHMDVNAIVYAREKADDIKLIQSNASLNVKRPLFWSRSNWLDNENQHPYFILDLQEVKTTWHPIGQ